MYHVLISILKIRFSLFTYILRLLFRFYMSVLMLLPFSLIIKFRFALVTFVAQLFSRFYMSVLMLQIYFLISEFHLALVTGISIENVLIF